MHWCHISHMWLVHMTRYSLLIGDLREDGCTFVDDLICFDCYPGRWGEDLLLAVQETSKKSSTLPGGRGMKEKVYPSWRVPVLHAFRGSLPIYANANTSDTGRVVRSKIEDWSINLWTRIEIEIFWSLRIDRGKIGFFAPFSSFLANWATNRASVWDHDKHKRSK